MTAALLALRVKQGTVDLSDRVDKYLINSYHIPRITLLDLADMESGLQRNPPDPHKNPANETQLYDDLQACVGDPACWKGVNHYIYSNFGYGVLGNVLANHDGPLKWSLDNFYYVMAPLGMFNTRAAEDFTSLEFSARRSYGHAPARRQPLDRTSNDQCIPLSTPRRRALVDSSDMLVWLKNATGASLGNREVDAALRMTMECRGPWGKNSTCSSVQECGRCAGLAWTEDIDQCTGGIRIFKSGAQPGFRAWIGFDKGSGRGVFVLLNSGAIKGDIVGEMLLDMIP
jgi:CubicO group peptidase (beta-lactamase class C family)